VPRFNCAAVAPAADRMYGTVTAPRPQQAPPPAGIDAPPGFTLPTVKRFSPTSGIGKPAVNRRKPLETARNDNSNSKTGNRCLPTGNRCLPTGNRRF